MYRPIKNLLKGRKKVKDESARSHTYRRITDHTSLGVEFHYDANCPDYSFYYSLSHFLEILKGEKESKDLVIFRETHGWEPRIKFSWNKPQSFSPQEAADYIVERKLLDDHWNHYESRWQIYSGRGQEQHYFDIDIYLTTFPMGSMEIGGLMKKITLDCLLSRGL